MAQQRKRQTAPITRRGDGLDASVSQLILDAGFYPPGLISTLQELPWEVTKWQTDFTLAGYQVRLECRVPEGVGGIPHGADHALLGFLVQASQAEVGQRTGHRVVRMTAGVLLRELRALTLQPLDLVWLRRALDRLVRATYHWHQRPLQSDGTPGRTGTFAGFYLLSQFSTANTLTLQGDLSPETLVEIVLLPELIALYTTGLSPLVQVARRD